MRTVLLALLTVSLVPADQPASHSPQLLLSAKLLRRLKRDRERQTVRWMNFENRVKTVPDSPERGFELALYIAITGDDTRVPEALTWAAAHPCERRQRALIIDWAAPVPPLPCPTASSLRDEAFESIAVSSNTDAIAERVRTQLIPRFAKAGVGKPEDLYALIELVSALRASSGKDLRNADPLFFRNLPTEFLLSMKPSEVEHPAWMNHIAALALVTIDPNLEASQFLQGWAMEDRQTLRDGPGVAYELLWADPYLPGIAYQNLDPWVYNDEDGRLFARTDWTVNSCWIEISKAGVQDQQCPANWRSSPAPFGTMTLIPMPTKCLDIPHQDMRQTIIVWKLNPGQPLTYGEKNESTANADISGLWRPGTNVEGNVCRR